MRVTVGDSSLHGCVCVASSERLLVSLFSNWGLTDSPEKPMELARANVA